MLSQASDLEIFQLEVLCGAASKLRRMLRFRISRDAFCYADLAVITANGMRFRA